MTAYLAAVNTTALATFGVVVGITLIVTFVPGLPRMRFTASASCMSFVARPSILTIRSPVCRPARLAGVPSIGATTVRMSSYSVISMPRPPKLPEVSTCISR